MPIAKILGLEYDEIKNFRGPVRHGARSNPTLGGISYAHASRCIRADVDRL